MNTLIMMVGLPRSGKSTRAKELGFPIVNPDSIRLALHGQPFVQSAEPLVWATAHLMVDSLFLAGHETVILDACNVTWRRRNEWKSEQYQRVYEVIETDIAVCHDRAAACGQDYLHKVIDRMARDWESVNG